MSGVAVRSPSSESVRFERWLPGPIERVWDYLTRPDLQKTWLAGSASELAEIRACTHLRSLEYSMRDSSVVSLELEACGDEVRLVLTHRRLPGWLAGAGTVLAVALVVFSFCRPEDATRLPQSLGAPMVQSAAGLNSLHLNSRLFTLC